MRVISVAIGLLAGAAFMTATAGARRGRVTLAARITFSLVIAVAAYFAASSLLRFLDRAQAPLTNQTDQIPTG